MITVANFGQFGFWTWNRAGLKQLEILNIKTLYGKDIYTM